jgi:hypothetical protein
VCDHLPLYWPSWKVSEMSGARKGWLMDCPLLRRGGNRAVPVCERVCRWGAGAGTRPKRHRGGPAYLQAESRLSGLSRLGGRRSQDGQSDADGANLRVTKLDRAKLIVAIKCGIPGKSMPAFDRLAYSDGRCYGLKEADLQRMNTTLPDPPRRSSRARSNRSPTSCSRRWSARGRWTGPVHRVLGLRRRHLQGVSQVVTVSPHTSASRRTRPP